MKAIHKLQCIIQVVVLCVLTPCNQRA